MPTKTINDLTNTANILDGDELAFWNLANSRTDKISYAQFKTDIFGGLSADTEILFNNAGNIDGDPRLTYDPALNRMAIGIALGGGAHMLQLLNNEAIGSSSLSLSFTRYGNTVAMSSNTNITFSGTVFDFTPNAYTGVSGNERTIDIAADITGQTGTSTFAGFYINILDTARASSGVANAVQVQNDGTSIFEVGSGGKVGVGAAVNDSLPKILQIPTDGQIGDILFSGSFLQMGNDIILASNNDVKILPGVGFSVTLQEGAVNKWEITSGDAVITPTAYTAASGNERTLDITADITGQSGTATWAGFYMNILDTTWGGATANAIQIQNDGSDVFTVDKDGLINIVDTTDTTFSTSKLLTRDAGGVVNTIVASGGGTVNFLNADGAWTAPVGNVSVTNQADNRIVTATAVTDTLNAEANLTFDGTSFTVTAEMILNGNIDLNTSFPVIDMKSTTGGDVITMTTIGSGTINKSFLSLEAAAAGQATLKHLGTVATTFGSIDLADGDFDLRAEDAAGTARINGSSAGSITVTVTGGGSSSMLYAADYSGNFVARSLVDKGFTDATYLSLAGGTLTGDLTISAQNLITDTTTGMQLWTAAAQKGAFWGLTPVVQPLHIIDADGTLADITTKFNTLLAQMATTGLQAAT